MIDPPAFGPKHLQPHTSGCTYWHRYKIQSHKPRRGPPDRMWGKGRDDNGRSILIDLGVVQVCKVCDEIWPCATVRHAP